MLWSLREGGAGVRAVIPDKHFQGSFLFFCIYSLLLLSACFCFHLLCQQCFLLAIFKELRCPGIRACYVWCLVCPLKVWFAFECQWSTYKMWGVQDPLFGFDHLIISRLVTILNVISLRKMKYSQIVKRGVSWSALQIP